MAGVGVCRVWGRRTMPGEAPGYDISALNNALRPGDGGSASGIRKRRLRDASRPEADRASCAAERADLDAEVSGHRVMPRRILVAKPLNICGGQRWPILRPRAVHEPDQVLRQEAEDNRPGEVDLQIEGHVRALVVEEPHEFVQLLVVLIPQVVEELISYIARRRQPIAISA